MTESAVNDVDPGAATVVATDMDRLLDLACLLDLLLVTGVLL